MLHLTLNTGHVRESPRSEVADDVIETLRPLVRTTGGPLPQPPGASAQLTHTADGVAFTIFQVVRDVSPGWTPGRPAPLVTCMLAATPDHSRRAWFAIPAGWRDGWERPTSTPWLAVYLHPTIALVPDAAPWLGDAERCIAWALIDETQRVQ